MGATWDLPWGGITANFDYIHSEWQDPAQYTDVSQTIRGTTVLGLPIYDFTNGSDNLMLSNSVNEGSGDLLSIMLRKDFGNGLDMSFGYAYVDAEDVTPMTSFTASTSFDNLATSDINIPSPAVSNYVVPHRFTFRASYAKEFFGDLRTRFTVLAYVAEGQPQSYVMGNRDQLEGDGGFGRHLLYVPTGPSDSNVIFQPEVQAGAVDPVTGNVSARGIPAFDTDAFFAWIAREGLPPGIVPRNFKHAPWSNRLDIRIDQDIPTFIEGTSGRIFFKMYNFGNFLSKDWGVVNDAEFFSSEIIETNTVQGPNPGDPFFYAYQEFNDRSIVDLKEQRSLWEARIGIDIYYGD